MATSTLGLENTLALGEIGYASGDQTRAGLAWFEDLYRSHGARMKSVACNLLGTMADAEDAVQEAFLRAYRAREGFKGEANPSTWLHRILVNVCYDVGRQRQRRPPGPELPEEQEPAHPRAAVVDHPLRLTLERGLRRLEPRQRAVFVLFEVEGFSHREIGEVLSIPEGTSKNLLFVAKRALRTLIAPSGKEARS